MPALTLIIVYVTPGMTAAAKTRSTPGLVRDWTGFCDARSRAGAGPYQAILTAILPTIALLSMRSFAAGSSSKL